MSYNILIVDDDTELQKMLKNYFRLKDFQVNHSKQPRKCL